jgi:hypothetical protein
MAGTTNDLTSASHDSVANKFVLKLMGEVLAYFTLITSYVPLHARTIWRRGTTP